MSGAARAVWPAEFTLGTRRGLRHQVPAAPVFAAVPPVIPTVTPRAAMSLGACEFLLPAVAIRTAAITTGVAAGWTYGSAGTADAGVC